MFIYGVNNGQVVEVSLGYFINPLVTVLMGVSSSASGCGRPSGSRSASPPPPSWVLTLDYGRPPWVALTLAFSSAATAWSRSADVGAVEGLDLRDRVLVAPLAAGVPWWLARHGRGPVRRRAAPGTRCCWRPAAW